MMIKKKHKNEELDHSYKIMSFMGELVAGGDHEINNLIMMIQGSSQILQDDDSSPEQKSMAIDSINKKTARIKEIIADLRSVFKDGAEEQSKTFYVKELINKSISLCKTRFKNHRIFISSNISPTLQLDGKEIQIIQSILAVLTSTHDAIMHNDNRWVKLDVHEDEEFIFFDFADSGKELSNHDLKNIFNSSYKTNDGRTGLGLLLAKQIVEEHKGRLFIFNKNNHPFVSIKIPKNVQNVNHNTESIIKVVGDYEDYNSEVVEKIKVKNIA